jgi:DNA adenine methylase
VSVTRGRRGPAPGKAETGAGQTTPPRALPFVKWAGGKRRLVGAILAAAPPAFERYLEPFVGGGAVALALGHRPMLLNDANAELIDAYRAVRDDLPALLDRLDAYAAAHSEARFYAVRALDPAALPPMERAARFIYLNKTCFNGLWRVNRHGAFNTPSGRYARPVLYDRERLAAAGRVLQGATLAAGDYRAFLDRHARAGDFIYLDPPYAPAGRYADFKRYTPEQFRDADQAALADVYADLIRRGAYPVLSNADTPLARRLYADHMIREVQAARRINHDGAGRGSAPEILVLPRRVSSAQC